MAGFGSFVALGDSFSEGVGDPQPDGQGWRGWADRFAERCAAHVPGFRYANLAVRGKLLTQVLADQVPLAAAMAPDLVSLAAGGNDLLRPRTDPDELGASFDAAVLALTEAGAQVLAFTGFDPRAFPLVRMVRRKAAVYNSHIRVVAAQRGLLLVDLWSMRVLHDPREWREDRLHMAPDGHRRVALRACEVTGVPVAQDWREPLPPGRPASGPGGAAAGWLAHRRGDVRWARVHAAPWVSRRLRGISSGDGVSAKRPELRPL